MRARLVIAGLCVVIGACFAAVEPSAQTPAATEQQSETVEEQIERVEPLGLGVDARGLLSNDAGVRNRAIAAAERDPGSMRAGGFILLAQALQRTGRNEDALTWWWRGRMRLLVEVTAARNIGEEDAAGRMRYFEELTSAALSQSKAKLSFEDRLEIGLSALEWDAQTPRTYLAATREMGELLWREPSAAAIPATLLALNANLRTQLREEHVRWRSAAAAAALGAVAKEAARSDDPLDANFNSLATPARTFVHFEYCRPVNGLPWSGDGASIVLSCLDPVLGNTVQRFNFASGSHTVEWPAAANNAPGTAALSKPCPDEQRLAIDGSVFQTCRTFLTVSSPLFARRLAGGADLASNITVDFKPFMRNPQREMFSAETGPVTLQSGAPFFLANASGGGRWMVGVIDLKTGVLARAHVSSSDAPQGPDGAEDRSIVRASWAPSGDVLIITRRTIKSENPIELGALLTSVSLWRSDGSWRGVDLEVNTSFGDFMSGVNTVPTVDQTPSLLFGYVFPSSLFEAKRGSARTNRGLAAFWIEPPGADSSATRPDSPSRKDQTEKRIVLDPRTLWIGSPQEAAVRNGSAPGPLICGVYQEEETTRVSLRHAWMPEPVAGRTFGSIPGATWCTISPDQRQLLVGAGDVAHLFRLNPTP